MDAKGSGSKFDEGKNIHTITKGKNSNFAVEKPDRHLIQLIKISTNNEVHCLQSNWPIDFKNVNLIEDKIKY